MMPRQRILVLGGVIVELKSRCLLRLFERMKIAVKIHNSIVNAITTNVNKMLYCLKKIHFIRKVIKTNVH